ncbi:GLPGLI family protein [Chryseobacterium sp. SLBN-27]|jgi:GLPGLI family protein|uniref:GLPGLI family protein n=1 Tax=Chryseobacterium sp. SLBN-27 TaxID=3042287 RepID=UPI00286314E9|nr:GLPGLI family protein [Chryseobacterium sp. SLBN-27]MDR6157170.1 GLPGLI family protein [Chryseobacterium sp. SLBN-27]
MMKKNFLILLLFSIGVNAQINRFFYDYKYIPNTNDKTKSENKLMVLDIDKQKGSNYYTDKSHKLSDSLSKTNEEDPELKKLKSEVAGSDFKKITEVKSSITIGDDYDYRVIKQYPDYKTYLVKNISFDTYKIIEDQKIVWKIFPDKQKIGEFNAQKATTSFGGRQWTAWFTVDIPFQDGPYKFCGLPGLIVKIEDDTASHIMTLVGNKIVEENNEIKADENLPKNLASIVKGNEIEVTKEKFHKIEQDYKKDPSIGLKLLMGSLGNGANVQKVIIKEDGKPSEDKDINDVYKLIEKASKESEKNNNNPIELDLEK